MPDRTLTPDASTRAAVEELLSRSAYALDEREDRMLADCFAADAVLSLRVAGGDVVGPFEGREAIMGLMRGAWESQADKRRHVVSNFLYPAEDPPATGEGAIVVLSYLTLYATENGETRLLTGGIYRDEVGVGEDGLQLLRRHLDLDNGY